MVAYSFQERFVARIRAGLLSDEEWRRRKGTTAVLADVPPKRQTIRAQRHGKGGHARPGNEVQLYYHQRHKDGFLIGKACCVSCSPITMHFGSRAFCAADFVESDATGLVRGIVALSEFATRDGFNTWLDLRAFWAENHPGVENFAGWLIRWEPLT